MSNSREIEAQIIKATRRDADSPNGLITFKILIPLYVWVELLTHRSLARNASSGRAMSTKRYTDMGFFMPAVFYKIGEGMVSSDEPIENQEEARGLWISAWENALNVSNKLTQLGVAKEQANRIIPPIKMIRGIVTGTEAAWAAFLDLRLNPNADKAMQLLANKISEEIKIVNWTYAKVHNPLCDGDDLENIKIGVARLARVSYNRTHGSKSDIELTETLSANKHLSPFEHIAFSTKFPPKSAFTSFGDKDLINNYGWVSYRHFIENNKEVIYD